MYLVNFMHEMFLHSTRISLIICRELVLGYKENKRLTAPQLASKYSINLRMVNLSLRHLVKAGVLNSQVGGSSPGFIFSKDPKLISLFEVVSVFEDEMKMMCCKDVISNIKCDIYDCTDCLVYTGINDKLNELRSILKSTSIYSHYESCLN